MQEAIYGVSKRTQATDRVSVHIEEILLQGYSIIEGIFTPKQLEVWREKIDAVYKRQEFEYGRDGLAAIGDLDTCRAPLLYDFSFLEMASIPLVLAVAKNLLDNWMVLHLQNALINRPEVKHPQAAWHRDLPYQNFVISKPLAISAIVVIDDFTSETGGTRLLPFSHQNELLPSVSYIDKCAIDIIAPAGSVLVFDSMLFHQGGFNMSGCVRRAVNHVYVSPILKQQYDFPRALGPRDDLNPALMQLLGYTSQVSVDDRAWRNARINRIAKAE